MLDNEQNPAPAEPEAKVDVASESPAQDAAPPQEGESASSEAPSEPANSEDDAPRKPKVSFNERISQIHAARKQAEADRDFAVAEAHRLRADLERLRSVDLEQVPFEQHDAIRQKAVFKEALYEEKAAAANAHEQFVRQTEAAAFNARIEAVNDRIPDFREVVMRPVEAGGPPISDFAARFIASSDKGPEVAYWLGKNTNEARRIAHLPEGMQGAELARIEARITSAPTVRKTSQAPAPVPTIGGTKAVATKDPANMSMAEYSEWYASRGKRA